MTKIYIRDTTNILRIFESTEVSAWKAILSDRLSSSILYFFYENYLSSAKS